MLPCALDRFTPIAGQDDVIAFKTQKGLIISRVSASSSAKRMVARGEVREEEGYFISHRTLLTPDAGMALGGSYFKPRIDEILLHSVGE